MILPPFVLATWRSLSFRWFFLCCCTMLGASGAWAFTVLEITQHLRHPPPYPNAPQLFTVVDRDTLDSRDLPGPAFVRWRDAVAGEVRVAAYRRIPEALVGDEGREHTIEASLISSDLLDCIQVSPAVGRGFDPSDSTPSDAGPVLLAWNLAVRLFGDATTALDRSVVVDGRPRIVRGVMPRGFWFPTTSTQLWMPLDVVPFYRFGNRVSIPYFATIARLSDEIRPVHGSEVLRDHVTRATPSLRGVEALTLARIDETWYRVERQASLVVSALMAMMWCSALSGAFLIGLAWWTSSRPPWEIACALGARPWHFTRELLWAASLVTAGSATLTATLITLLRHADLGGGDLGAIAPPLLPRLDWTLLAAGTAGASLVACLLAPLVGLATDAMTTRHAGATPRYEGLRVWSSVTVVGQIALATVGIVTTVGLTSAMHSFVAGGYGFRVDDRTLVTTLRVKSSTVDPAQGVASIVAPERGLRDRLGPAQRLGITDRPVYQTPAIRAEVAVANLTGAAKQLVGVRIVGEGYFEAAGIHLEVPWATRLTADGLVVSQSVARMVGLQVGGTLLLADTQWRIENIAADVRQPGSDGSAGMVVYVAYAGLHRLPVRLQQEGLRAVAIVTGPTPGSAHSGANAEDVVGGLLGAAATAVSTQTTIEAVSSLAPQLQVGLRMARAFAFIGISIAVCGLLGTWFHRLWTNRWDLGVRLALGATTGRLLLEETRRVTLLVAMSGLLAAGAQSMAWPLVTGQIQSPAPLPRSSVVLSVLCVVLAASVGLVSAATIVVVRRPVRSLLRDGTGAVGQV